MNRISIALLLALMMLSLCPATRGARAETTSAIPREADPNDPKASPEERIRRQKLLIMERIKHREAELQDRKAEENARTVAENAQISTSTRKMMAEMPEKMNELTGEFEKIRAQINDLINRAVPALKKAVAQPEPRSFKVEVQAKLMENQELQLTGYGDEKIIFSAPLITSDPASKMTLVGSFEFTASLKPLDTPGKVQAEYQATMDVPVVQRYNSGSGNNQSGGSSGQVTFRCGTNGKVVLKAGEPKEIIRIGENTIRLTVTPE